MRKSVLAVSLLAGLLVPQFALCQVETGCGTDTLLTGDFNGDGRADVLCYSTLSGGTTRVLLGGPNGLATAAIWLQGTLKQPFVGDLDSDGRTDLVSYDSALGDFYVALSTGSAFAPLTFWGRANALDPKGVSRTCQLGTIDVGVGDFNGDGTPDVYCRKATGPKIFVGLSTGSSFNFSIFGQWTCDASGERVGTLDFDGDGKDDWYCMSVQSGAFYVYLSTGTAFAATSASLAAGFCGASQYVFGDLNADGRADAACLGNGKVALATGRSFLEQGEYGGWCTASTAFFAADVDGDGGSEIVCNNPGAGADDILVRRWYAGAFRLPGVWKASFCAATTLYGGDFDGDGKTDILCNGIGIATAGTAGLQSDLLTSASTELGGTVQLAYTTSTAFANTNGPPPKYAVTSVTRLDGRGGSAKTNYSYSGGLMDRKERRFLGFRSARETRPCLSAETACPYVDRTLRQDLASAGKLERLEFRDGLGRLQRSEVYEYTTSVAVPQTSLLTGVWSHAYDGGGGECPSWPCLQGKRTYTTYAHDAYGNVTQTVSHGDYDASGDETTAVVIFRPNATAYIVDRMAAAQSFAGVGSMGAKLTETLVYYDGANTWDLPPSQGYPTATWNWLDVGNRHVGRFMGYDAFGNVTSVTDETNRTVTTAYDPTHHVFPTSVTNSAGESETTSWDAVCRVPTQHTDANNQVSIFQSDALCRLVRTDRPLGGFEIRSYLDFGNASAQRVVVETPSATPEDGSGNDSLASYFDGLRRPYHTVKKGPTSSQEILQDTAYNARGQIASRTAPYYTGETAQATTYGYDSFDRLTSVRFPDSQEVRKTYGLWSETTTDEHGHETTARFDAYGRRSASEQRLSGQTLQTHYSYDLLGRLVGLTDPAGNAWSWTFDSVGRNTQKSDPDAGVWTFDYDDAGRVLAQVDAKGQRTDFTFDGAGRLATKTSGGQTTSFTHSEARAGFFNAGQVTTIGSALTTLKMDYDGLGRMVKQTRILDGMDYIAERRYDAGFLRGISYPDGDTVGTPSDPLRYDAAGRLKSIPGILSEVVYDAPGRPTRQTNLNGTTTTRSYSPERGFLTAISTLQGTSTLQNLAYTSDAAGLLTTLTSPFANESWSYVYDELHRLTSATSPSQPSESQTFQYDEIGNVTYNSRVGSYGYPPAGSARPHAPATVAGGSYTYDLNGNLVSGGSRTITWNADKLPSQIGATQFAYDGLGERVKKVTGVSTSLYPLGDDYEVTGGVVTKYVSVDGLGVIAKRVGAQTFWLHTDRLGSIQLVTDASGAEVQRRTYRPYGDKIADTTSHTESRGWIDQRQDAETGLTYLHARYYDPAVGVFLSPDPAGADLNAFAYSFFGDPINLSDRSGLDPPCGTEERPCIIIIPPGSLLPAPGGGAPGPGPGGPGSGTPGGGGDSGGGAIGGGGPFYGVPGSGGGCLFCSGAGKRPGPPGHGPDGGLGGPHGPSGPGTGPVGPGPGPGPGVGPGAVPDLSAPDGDPTGSGAPSPSSQPGAMDSDRARIELIRQWAAAIDLFAGIVSPVGASIKAPIAAARFGKIPLGLRTTYLYSLWAQSVSGARGEFLKWGISWNPARRYPFAFMRDKILQIETSTPIRRPIFDLERSLTEVAPGRLNREPWAGRRLVELEP